MRQKIREFKETKAAENMEKFAEERVVKIRTKNEKKAEQVQQKLRIIQSKQDKEREKLLEKEAHDATRVPLKLKPLDPMERVGGGGGTTRTMSFSATNFFQNRENFLKERKD